MKKKDYWKDQELFSKYTLEYILNLLVKEKFQFKTFSWTYQLEHILEKGTAQGGSQLTDKILVLLFTNLETSEIIKSFLYIESKAYFSQSSSSITSIEKSFKKFYTDLWRDYWYASMFCIFKWWEKSSVYPFLDKLISDDTDCPDMYFEVTEESFLDNKFKNTLEPLFKKSITIDEKSEKLLLFEKYRKYHPTTIDNLKKLLAINIKLSFSTYENSEKRLNLLLENRCKLDKKNTSIQNKADHNKWFRFDCDEIVKDLSRAESDQEKYLLNKYHYFDNPLIQKKIHNIEKNLSVNIFPEMEDESNYSNLRECSEAFISRFWSVLFPSNSDLISLRYLFDWWSAQKRWFMFDSWANKKLLLHYQKDKSINFINNY